MMTIRVFFLNSEFQQDLHNRVHDFFGLLGKSFSIMAVAIVAGLECFYNSPNWHLKGICITALARLVFENDKIFLEEDNYILFY